MKTKRVARLLAVVSLLKKAQNAQQPYITYRYNKDIVSVLHIMAGHGFIRSFDIKNRAFIIIWLKGLRGVSGVWHPSFRDAQRVPHYRRNPESISRKLIRRLSSADGGSSLYLLSTDMGIMTHLDAIRHNVGGKLLFKII